MKVESQEPTKIITTDNKITARANLLRVALRLSRREVNNLLSHTTSQEDPESLVELPLLREVTEVASVVVNPDHTRI